MKHLQIGCNAAGLRTGLETLEGEGDQRTVSKPKMEVVLTKSPGEQREGGTARSAEQSTLLLAGSQAMKGWECNVWGANTPLILEV
jgi:hypothetical protein